VPRIVGNGTADLAKVALGHWATIHVVEQECPMAREIWKQLGNWIEAPSLMPENRSQVEHRDDWFVALIVEASPSARPGMRLVITLTIWEQFLERNSRVFKKTLKTVQQIVHSIQDEAHNWILAGNKNLEQLIPALPARQNLLPQVFPP
jgi:hypothetical protein